MMMNAIIVINPGLINALIKTDVAASVVQKQQNNLISNSKHDWKH